MDNSLAISTGSTALISALFLQMLKHASWFPWLSIEQVKQRANFVASIVLALAVSLGISAKYDSAAGSILITGLTAASLQHGLYHAAFQWVAQHVSYKAFIVPSELLAAIVSQLKVMQTPSKGA